MGDTLDTIGGYFGVPRQDIVAANPSVNPAALAPNSFVKLPPWDPSVCPEPGNTAACRVYIAETGDSLSVIATAFSIPLADLQAQNTGLGVDSTTVLQPGMRVQLPPFPDNCGAGGQEMLCAWEHPFLHCIAAIVAARAPHPCACSVLPCSTIRVGVQVSKPSNCRAYLVVEGDTVASIAAMVRQQHCLTRLWLPWAAGALVSCLLGTSL
jgi:LysM repeat protein